MEKGIRRNFGRIFDRTRVFLEKMYEMLRNDFKLLSNYIPCKTELVNLIAKIQNISVTLRLALKSYLMKKKSKEMLVLGLVGQFFLKNQFLYISQF